MDAAAAPLGLPGDGDAPAWGHFPLAAAVTLLGTFVAFISLLISSLLMRLFLHVQEAFERAKPHEKYVLKVPFKDPFLKMDFQAQAG